MAQRDPDHVQELARDQQARLGAPSAGCLAEEALAASWNDPDWGPKLRPVVQGMWRALDFDAQRSEAPLTDNELERQTRWVADAYLDALWHCSGSDGTPPPALYWLSRAATAVHMVRDLEEDLALGYCNVPLSAGCHRTGEPLTPAQAHPWMRVRLRTAEDWFQRGRSALPMVHRLRTRLLLRLFAWRYERTSRTLAAALSEPRRGLDSAP